MSSRPLVDRSGAVLGTVQIPDVIEAMLLHDVEVQLPLPPDRDGVMRHAWLGHSDWPVRGAVYLLGMAPSNLPAISGFDFRPQPHG